MRSRRPGLKSSVGIIGRIRESVGGRGRSFWGKMARVNDIIGRHSGGVLVLKAAVFTRSWRAVDEAGNTIDFSVLDLERKALNDQKD